MRFLFTTVPGHGHFNPIAPLAHALQAAGHTVAIATAPMFGEAVTRARLEFLPAGLDWDESRLFETQPELRAVPAERQGEWLMQTVFLDRSPRRMIPDLTAIVAGWRPDVMLSETFEFGGPLVAEAAGLPYASCSISLRWTRFLLKVSLGRAMKALRAEQGLPADPGFAAFGRYLDLCFVPPSWSITEALLRPELTRQVAGLVLASDLPAGQRVLGARALVMQRLLALDRWRHPEGAGEPTTHFIRPPAITAGDAVPPAWLAAWLAASPRRPTLYASLGTVFGGQYPQVFDMILAGLRDAPVNLILQVGEQVDPARFGPQPPHVRIERFFARETLAALLPHVNLCISHGGYGTVMDSLGHGIPLIVLPLAADQPLIAQLCFLDGVAPRLPAPAWKISAKGVPIVAPERLTPTMIADAALRALREPAYKAAARAARARIAAVPGLDAAVALVEQLGRTRTPMTRGAAHA